MLIITISGNFDMSFPCSLFCLRCTIIMLVAFAQRIYIGTASTLYLYDTHRTASRLETGKIDSLGKGWGLTISNHIIAPVMKQQTIEVSPTAILSLMHPCSYGTPATSVDDGTGLCLACYLEPGGGRVPLGKGTVCNCVVR